MSKPLAALAIFVLAGCEIYALEDHEGTSSHGEDRFRPDASVTIVDAPPQVAPPPILHYRFDTDVTNSGTLGRDLDGTGTSISFVAGKHGGAVAFDTTRYTQVLLPTQVAMSTSKRYTVGLWFREDVVWDGSLTTYLFDTRGAGGFHTYHGTGGAQALTTCSAAGCSAVGYHVGDWHHLMYRWDGSSGKGVLEIFVDGVLATTLPASDVYFSSTQTALTIGTRTNMQVDDLRVYDAIVAPSAVMNELPVE